MEARTGARPGNAAGWNVYVGIAPDALFRQNAVPIDAGANWIQSTAPVLEGKVPNGGQSPNYSLAVRRVLQRG